MICEALWRTHGGLQHLCFYCGQLYFNQLHHGKMSPEKIVASLGVSATHRLEQEYSRVL